VVRRSKGEFLLGNRQYCYPLTVTYHASRYQLSCEALYFHQGRLCFYRVERLFQERGLPSNIELARFQGNSSNI
jgi:hypothetical protein